MTRWDIDPAQAMGVVRRSASQAEDYAGDLETLSSALQSLVMAMPNSVRVAEAVVGLDERVVVPDVEAVMGHTDSALRGTVAAVAAYQAGDQEMAAQAQANAAAADYPDDMPGGVSYRAPEARGGR